MALVAATVITAPHGVFAQKKDTRDAFLGQQAYAEMQRVSGQVDVLQNNFDELRGRMSRLETGNDVKALRAEIDALRAEIDSLRRELANQRGEIVKDLSGRMAKMMPKEQPVQQRTVVVTGPTGTYIVQPGDSLYLIAKACNTTVAKIREMNSLKSDNLRIGQQLIVPQVKE